jgi:hypothetical protein
MSCEEYRIEVVTYYNGSEETARAFAQEVARMVDGEVTSIKDSHFNDVETSWPPTSSPPTTDTSTSSA